MIRQPFYKYQGTGNDFIMIDNRRGGAIRRDDEALIRRLCDRRFGIGADGLILLQDGGGCDFEMVYFNADGREGSLCGNGGRCTVAFAGHLGLIGEKTRFMAVDGEHEALLHPGGRWVDLKMGAVRRVERGDSFYFMNTGSPHYIVFVPDLSVVDVVREGRAVRYSERFRAAGTNVNFVQPVEGGIAVATYERGVEDETLSCGTGVTAAAIAYYLEHPARGNRPVDIQAKGGKLQVRFQPAAEGFDEIWLCGPAERVFEGSIELEI